MEYVNNIRSSLIQALPEQLCTSVGRLAENFATYRTRRAIYRRTLNELQALSDRELQDINIPRFNIRKVALAESRKAVNDG